MSRLYIRSVCWACGGDAFRQHQGRWVCDGHADSPPCQACGGRGEVRHRSYGTSTCPEPTEPCQVCDGTGMA